jgi:hypothetical protein
MYAWTMLITSCAISNPEKNWYPVNVISIGFLSRNKIHQERMQEFFLNNLLWDMQRQSEDCR